MKSVVKKVEFSFDSSKEGCIIKGFKMVPENEVSAVLIVVHGMIEHSEKYEHFMNNLAQNNIVSYAHDHLGHKNSVLDKEDLGFFDDDFGYLRVLEDMHSVFKLAKNEYPNKKIFLMGHSMGSFFARVFAVNFPETIDGLILSGTGQSGPDLIMGKMLVNTIAAFKGNRYRSKLVAKMTSNKFMSGVKNPKTNAAWLTKDEEIELRISKDEYCNFVFTLGAYKDLFTIMGLSDEKRVYTQINKEMPIYIFSGDMDPVGNFGKSPLAVLENYKNQGVKNASCKLYKDGRHEMINEINKDEVYTDVVNWIKNTTN